MEVQYSKYICQKKVKQQYISVGSVGKETFKMYYSLETLIMIHSFMECISNSLKVTLDKASAKRLIVVKQ